jgi:hypothetical protein
MRHALLVAVAQRRIDDDDAGACRGEAEALVVQPAVPDYPDLIGPRKAA